MGSPDLAQTPDEVRNILRALESQRFAATTARDFARLSDIFDDRLSYTHSSGVRDTKDEYLQAVRERVYVYGAIEHAEDTIHVTGDSAIVIGSMRAGIEVNGTPKQLANASLAVWTRSRDGWKLIAYQTTPLPK